VVEGGQGRWQTNALSLVGMEAARYVDDAEDILHGGGDARLVVGFEHWAIDGEVGHLGQDARKARGQALECSDVVAGILRAVPVLGSRDRSEQLRPLQMCVGVLPGGLQFVWS